MKSLYKRRGAILLCVLLLILVFTPFWKTDTVKADAASDVIRIEKYDAEFDIRTDRKIEVVERITVTFLQFGLTMFYRSFPTEGCLYENITAKCEGNDEFRYNVADNPDMDGFFDVNCIGGVEYDKTWTYEISYVMQDSTNAVKDGMIFDATGFGWTVPLNDVMLTFRFPKALESGQYATYIGGYGVEREESKAPDQAVWSEDRKTLTVYQERLDVVYNRHYGEYAVEGITVEFDYGGNVMDGYVKTRVFTDDMWKILLLGIAVLALSVLAFVFLKNRREIITTVNIKAPDGMDPLQMGKYLDGNADNEDVTSMIYYFAYQGYLKIDMSDSDDPKLISLRAELPVDAPTHQKTLFNGLFRSASVIVSDDPFAMDNGLKEIRISELTGTFFETMKTAEKQTPSPHPMYEKKSVFGYLLGGILSILFGFFIPFWMGRKIGGGYLYLLGIVLAIPTVAILVLGYIKENYRYKWKKKTKGIVTLVQYALALVFSLAFIFLFARFFMTGFEKGLLCFFTFACCIATQGTLSRREKYVDGLGQILGFKEFIVVTEEDKIKFMLEENPELYYKILPYAQVLGVTDEWEKKFEKITLEPPTWYVGDFTVFDYMILSSCMRRSMLRAMAAAAQKASAGGGRFIGRSGGGGSFGGFGGGGFGGGGGGAR